MYMSLFYVYIISIRLGYFGLKGFQTVFYTNGGFYEKKVLVVDDEQSILTLLQYNLQQSGYEVLTA